MRVEGKAVMRATQFVGRRDQLDDIQHHLFHIMTGQPRVVLVRGGVGIGKTRFLARVRTMAIEMGLQVFSGQCGETLTQPYAPFADLLRHLKAQIQLGDLEEDDLLDETDVELLRGLSLRSAPSFQPGPVYHAESDKFRLMMAISRATARFALQTPMLILVDDLHLADPFSLDLFAYLSFFMIEQRRAPLLLMGSFCHVVPESRLGELLSRLLREGMSRETELAGLNETETCALLRDLGVMRPTRQLVRAIQDTTHGAPLFIEELVPFLIQKGALYARAGAYSTRRRAIETLDLPRTIADAIAARLTSFPERCDPILTVAACLGERFSADRLQRVVPTDPSGIWDVIEVGIESGVLLYENGEYRFAHALIRHAFQARLHPTESQHLHVHIAQALETLYTGELEAHILEIAYHWVASGELADTHTVVPHMRQAGNQAFAMFAWGDAARYYEAALRAADITQGASDQLKADLHYQAGLSHYRNQDVDPSQNHFEQSGQLYRALGDMHGLVNTLIWQTMLQFMHASLPVGVLPDVQPLHATLDALGHAEPTLSGHLLTIISQVYRHAKHAEEADTMAQRALSIGRDIHDHFICTKAHNALGLAYLSKLEVQRAIDSWKESVNHAQYAEDLWQYSLPLVNLPLALNLKGRLEEAEVQAQEGGEVARDIQDWGGYSKALSHLASVSAAKGDFRATAWYASETMRMAARSRYPWGGFRALQALAGTLALRGLRGEAEQALLKIVEPGLLFKTPGRFEQVLVRVFLQLARCYQSEDLTENVATLCDELMDIVKSDTYSLAPLCAMIELGELTLNPAVTERPAAMLARAVEQGVMLTSGWCFVIPRVLAVAAAMRGEWDRAGAHFVHAIRVAQDVEAWPELARSYLDFARMALIVRELNDYAVIQNALHHASTILNEFKMSPHAKLALQMQKTLTMTPGRFVQE